MGKAEKTHAPVQQSVHVDCPIEDAFRLFTEEFAEWWPLSLYSATGAESDRCALEAWVGGRVYERTRAGEEYEWGSVTVWDPPRRVEFTWHPGERTDDRQTVRVEFQVEADGTRVTLTHAGWQQAGTAVCEADGQHIPAGGAMLARFAEFVCRQMLVLA